MHTLPNLNKFIDGSWGDRCACKLLELGMRPGIASHGKAVTCAALRPLAELGDALWHLGAAFTQPVKNAVSLQGPIGRLSVGAVLMAQASHVMRALSHLCKAVLTTITLPFAIIAPCYLTHVHCRIDTWCLGLLGVKERPDNKEPDVIAPEPLPPATSRSRWSHASEWLRQKAERHPHVVTAAKIGAGIIVVVGVLLTVNIIRHRIRGSIRRANRPHKPVKATPPPNVPGDTVKVPGSSIVAHPRKSVSPALKPSPPPDICHIRPAPAVSPFDHETCFLNPVRLLLEASVLSNSTQQQEVIASDVEHELPVVALDEVENNDEEVADDEEEAADGSMFDFEGIFEDCQDFFSGYWNSLSTLWSAAAPEPGGRKITLGVTYFGGNPQRDEMSQIVVNNHEEYARKWNIIQEVETHSLVGGQCAVGDTVMDCEPYWNKIAVLRRWLSSREGEQEEWFIMADDDMPITNMCIDPSHAIDALREGSDTSVIIARDIEAWDRGNPDTSVNTGVLIVRKDDASRSIFDNIWEQRNRPVVNGPKHCPTLGYCKNQYDLHEQRAFSNLLNETPVSIWQKMISVVQPRVTADDSLRKHIAINTFHRASCFVRKFENQYQALDYNKDPIEGRWTPSDWMGQATGIPVEGVYCTTKERVFKPEPLRRQWLQQMVDQVIKGNCTSV